jgi:hypothetical protein
MNDSVRLQGKLQHLKGILLFPFCCNLKRLRLAFYPWIAVIVILVLLRGSVVGL